MSIPYLTVTKEQFDSTVIAFENNELFDPLLLDERAPDGSITTVTLYDDESVLLQKIDTKGVLQYNIVPDAEYWAGMRIDS